MLSSSAIVTYIVCVWQFYSRDVIECGGSDGRWSTLSTISKKETYNRWMNGYLKWAESNTLKSTSPCRSHHRGKRANSLRAEMGGLIYPPMASGRKPLNMTAWAVTTTTTTDTRAASVTSASSYIGPISYQTICF